LITADNFTLKASIIDALPLGYSVQYIPSPISA